MVTDRRASGTLSRRLGERQGTPQPAAPVSMVPLTTDIIAFFERFKGFVQINPTGMGAIAAFFVRFREIAPARPRPNLAAMTRFVAAFAHHRPPRPLNVLVLLGLERDELVHSRMVAWLLSAREEHGCGPPFLARLAARCGLALEGDILENYTVRREFSYVEATVDILTYRRSAFVIAIENKVSSEEGVTQLAREFRDLRRLGANLDVPENRQRAVFLTPTGRAPSTAAGTDWVRLSYLDLLEMTMDVRPLVRSRKALAFLDDWCEAIRSVK